MIKDWPPNIDMIDKRFNVRSTPHILYCYGDCIYNPQGGSIPDWLVAHEYVHSTRQFELGMPNYYGEKPKPADDFQKESWHELGTILWWKRYCEDDEFRLEEELLAHKREMEVFKAIHNRHMSRGHLDMISGRLSSEMYGKMIGKGEAKRLINQRS